MDQRLLSIYIGSEVIRVVDATRKSATSITVNSVDEVSTPAGSFDDGYITDVLEIASAIRSKIIGKASKAKAVFTISSKKIASKEVVIPFVNGKKKIDAVLDANSSEYFPMSTTGDFVFAYNVMETFQDEDGKKLRVNAVAAPKDLVDCYYEVASELKLSIYDIDYVGNSVQQLLKLQMSSNESETNLVLQIEKDATFVNIMAGKDIILQRSVPYGKNAVINSIMEIKKLTEKEAIELLRDKDRMLRSVSDEEYSEAVRYLISSIGRIVEYHRSRNPERIIDGIKVFGEGASIAGIDEVLRQELGAEVTRFSSLNGVKVSQKSYLSADQALRFLACFGAVLNPIGLKISKESNREASSSLINKLLVAIVVLAALVMISVSAWFEVRYIIKNRDVENKKQKIAEMEIAEKVANEYDATVSAYNTVKAFVDTTHTDNVMLYKFLNDLEEIIPTGTTIDKLLAEDGTVVFTITTQGKEAIADAYVKIKALDYVREVSVVEIQEDNIDFEVENGHIVMDPEDVANINQYPYNYSTWRDEFEITVVIDDPDYESGTIESSDAIQEDDDDSSEVEEDLEVLE